ncbi:adenylate isopentenyltransferase 5, chloroplastic [Andrographis paniculata]|uniref:adenylate isopentenyltransferase 5, chloroplastic n=1 Tax=Andrographis paniculata TaxID=175694 RepID=UPI0021E8F605|nr:adenylate isopentenyltransferase 5, chloroplastic [Andrographis paniculata]XP_051127964.1 adenylate isopentenyltransferase 5, chloroplastic [Andrographis paniculata]
MMRISTMSACKQPPPPPPPLMNFPGGGMINMDQLIIPRQRRKEKAVVVMGATGTGKSRLSIDLATRFDAEVVNSDKMQVYKGLNIITNKVTGDECRGVPHHLLGFVDPDRDFSAAEFACHAAIAAADIAGRGRLPILAGGSNSCIKALVCDHIDFFEKYEVCFIWVDVSMPVLHSFVSKRVDQMVAAGLVEEAREFYDPAGDYSRGIRRAIGVPEMDEFFRAEGGGAAGKLLELGIEKIKANTCKLACTQFQNILRLCEVLEWRVHRVDATEAFLSRGEESDEAWERLVAGPSTRIVGQFLCEDQIDLVSTAAAAVILSGPTNAAVAAATH